jgi:hypothetical protein
VYAGKQIVVKPPELPKDFFAARIGKVTLADIATVFAGESAGKGVKDIFGETGMAKAVCFVFGFDLECV